MILLTKCFETYMPPADPEADACEGETESGFEFQHVPHGFRELVDMLREYTHPSCSHGVPDWVSTEPDQDCRTGDETTYSLHPARDARSQRYWAKAFRFAGRA